MDLKKFQWTREPEDFVAGEDWAEIVAVCALWRSQMRFSTAAMRSRTAARI